MIDRLKTYKINNLKPAFVISGQEVALGLARSLGQMGVPVIVLYYNSNDLAPFSKYVTKSFIVPHPEEFQEQFVDKIIEIGKSLGNGVLFPSSDEALVAVSQNKDKLDKYFLVACNNWNVVKKFIEKKYTYDLADSNSIPSPKTLIPKNIEDVKNYSKQIQFPCLIKPSQSHLFVAQFGKKMIVVNNEEELISVYNQTTTSGLEVMMQEIIEGDDNSTVNYNAYFYGGKPLLEFTAQQIRSAPPMWGAPRVVLSKEIPEIIDSGRKILQSMEFSGYACVEFKKDRRSNIYKLVEVNGRHNLSTMLAVKCGINFPYIHYKHIVFDEQPSFTSFKKNVYWINDMVDIIYSLRYLKFERYSLRQYLRPYYKAHVFAIFNFKDLKPFVKWWSFIFKRGVRATIKLVSGHKKKD